MLEANCISTFAVYDLLGLFCSYWSCCVSLLAKDQHFSRKNMHLCRVRCKLSSSVSCIVANQRALLFQCPFPLCFFRMQLSCQQHCAGTPTGLLWHKLKQHYTQTKQTVCRRKNTVKGLTSCIVDLILLLHCMPDMGALPSRQVPFGPWLACLSCTRHLQSACPVLHSLLDGSLMLTWTLPQLLYSLTCLALF